MSYPLQVGLLQQAERQLKQFGHHATLKSWTDRHGCYAYLMQAKNSNLPFALVAKGSKFSSETVSIHKQLIENWQSAIVLAHREYIEAPLVFYVVDPVRVRLGVSVLNERLGAGMVNFNTALLHMWNPEKDLLEMWEQIKKFRNEVLQV